MNKYFPKFSWKNRILKRIINNFKARKKKEKEKTKLIFIIALHFHS